MIAGITFLALINFRILKWKNQLFIATAFTNEAFARTKLTSFDVVNGQLQRLAKFFEVETEFDGTQFVQGKYIWNLDCNQIFNISFDVSSKTTLVNVTADNFALASQINGLL